MAVFQASELLIPRAELLENWAVIACDQFTFQPDYWREVRERVGEEPSAYHIIFPEAELGGDTSGRINPYGMRLSAPLSYNRSFREGCYRVENPDGILPASDKGRILLRYGGTDISAGVGYETDGRRVIALGFPLEALTSTSALDELMQKSMEYLIH